MKNLLKWFGIIALVALIGFSMAACGDDDEGTEIDDPGNGGGNPQKATYVSKDINGNKYTLEIDETGGSRSARSAAQVGDAFKLTVEINNVLPGGTTLTAKFEYSGKVETAKYNQETVKLDLVINGDTINITIVGTEMKIITGTLVDKDSGQTVVDNPGDVWSGNILVTGVTLSSTTLSLFVNGTASLTATVSPSDATNKAVTWSSSNTGVATLSSSGLVTTVTAKAAGTATITVMTSDGGKTATCTVTVTSTGTGPKPAVPTGLKMVVVSSNSLQVDWTGNAAADGYKIYRSLNYNGNFTEIVGDVPASQTTNASQLAFTFTDTGLAHNTRYNYKLTAYNENGESNQSGYVYATTKNIVPTGLKMTVVSPHSLKIDWTGNEDADGYKIYRSLTYTGNFTEIVATVLASQTTNASQLAFTWTDEGLAHNTRYNYKISAYNSHGDSAQSGYVYATTQNIVPTGLKMTVVSSSSLKIDWTGNADATEYYIWRTTGNNYSGNFTEKVATVLASSSSTLSYTWTDTGLTSNTRYNYKVSASNSFGESAQSGYVYATTQK